jgi:hypothetical protein
VSTLLHLPLPDPAAIADASAAASAAAASHDVAVAAVSCAHPLTCVVGLTRAAIDPFFRAPLALSLAAPGALAVPLPGEPRCVRGTTAAFCPVALAEDGVLVPGSNEHVACFDGAWYAMRDAVALERFMANPAAYATATPPQPDAASSGSTGTAGIVPQLRLTANAGPVTGTAAAAANAGSGAADDDGGGGPAVPRVRLVVTGPPSAGKSTQVRFFFFDIVFL